MREMQLNVQEIKELIDAFARAGLGELKIRQGDFCLELEGKKVEQIVPSAASPAVIVPSAAAEEACAAAPEGHIVTSPIVGTFYASPAPDKAPYVSVGSQVHKGDVLFIIESMKLMNEVTSEVDGVVKEILVSDAQGVEYGQPILVIE